MRNRRSLLAATLALALVAGIAGGTVQGWSGQRNTINFSGAVALPGAVLPAGEYKFEIMRGSPDLVRVSRASDNRSYYLGFTRSVPRPESLGNRAIVLGEAAAGTPPPIARWFPVEGGNGHEFVY